MLLVEQEDLIEELCQLKTETIGRLSQNHIKSIQKLRSRCLFLFGDIKNAMVWAGIYEPCPVMEPGAEVPEPVSYRPEKPRPNRRQLVEEIRRFVVGRNGAVPTFPEFVAATGIRAGRFEKLQLSWGKALEEAGFGVAPPRVTAEADLVADLQAVAANHGGTPSRSAYDAYGKYAAKTLVARFGSWVKALKAAGLQPFPTVFGTKTPAQKQSRTKHKKVAKAKKRETYESLGLSAIYEGSPTQFFLTRLVAEVLVENGLDGAFLPEHQFEWLVNTTTGKQFRVDTYYPGHHLAFEYQSDLHFKPSPEGYGSLEDVIRRDYLKRQLLQRHRVKLLEISYFEPHTKATIQEKLQALGVLPGYPLQVQAA